MGRKTDHDRGYHGRHTAQDRSDNPPDAPPGILAAFDLTLFSGAIQGSGLRFEWSRAVACPCRMDNTDQPDPSCTRCLGTGWWYVSPEVSRERHLSRTYIPVKAVPSMAKGDFRDQDQGAIGLWYGGEMQLTVQHEGMVGFRDKFRCLDQVMAFTQLLKRDTSSAAVPVGYWGRDRDEWRTAMRYEPLAIHLVADDDDNVYLRGTDWDIRERTESEPARLVWKSGRGPSNGARYTIHYLCHPVWIVADFTYGLQALQGPDKRSKGTSKPQLLPTTFKVVLDFLTDKEGS